MRLANHPASASQGDDSLLSIPKTYFGKVILPGVEDARGSSFASALADVQYSEIPQNSTIQQLRVREFFLHKNSEWQLHKLTGEASAKTY